MEGADGFKLMYVYFHLCSLGIRVGLCLIVVLIWVWKVEVFSKVLVWKSFFSIKSCNLKSYWWVGSITMEFPLSACVTIASLSFSLFWIELIVFASGCVLWVGFCLWSVSMRSANSLLYTSLSLVGSCVIAVSASSARVWIQSSFFA